MKNFIKIGNDLSCDPIKAILLITETYKCLRKENVDLMNRQNNSLGKKITMSKRS